MSFTTHLTELIALVRAQIEHVIASEHEALLAGAGRHEALLASLATMEPDGEKARIAALLEELERERTTLRSLLRSESARADLMLRLLTGARPQAGYPAGPAGAPTRMLNRRV